VLVDLETARVKLIDFGLASRLEARVYNPGNPEGLEGTLAYISPEQTGRTNRKVDYRTDLYSLGVTFYEMLTGQLPFASDDPLAVVNAHMTRAPRPVTALNQTVPPLVSDIVARLLAKNAEERYQSASGLTADLRRCLEYARSSRGLQSPFGLRFELGKDDVSGRFDIPEKLYGRSVEVSSLMADFERVSSGGRGLVLVAGPPGVGKSALVAEVNKPITEKRGYYVAGKFEQYRRNTPYWAFTQAFGALAELLLSEPEEVLRAERERILAAVGGNGAVLIEVMPGLEKVIGRQPEAPGQEGRESRNRLNLTFENFVRALATAAHPLVIFIDDWQWADLSSLELLKALLRSDAISHFLLIGAYRDSEVDRAHPWAVTVGYLVSTGVPVRTIVLDGLTPADVGRIVKESTRGPDAEVEELSAFIHGKTMGNPFFTRLYLHNLLEEGLLSFNAEAGCWSWNMERLRKEKGAEDPMDLVAARLRRLQPPALNLLRLASCVGSQFDLQTLALISRKDAADCLALLQGALSAGLVIPLNRFHLTPETASYARFAFLHDRVQHAAYEQIPFGQRREVHLEIGRLLLSDAEAGDPDKRIFDIVRHYERAGPLVTDGKERLRLVELNLRAADLAKRAAAFNCEQAFLEAAFSLTPVEAWDDRYEWMLRLHSRLALAYSLTGAEDRLERTCRIVETRAREKADTAAATQARILAHLYRGNFTPAIDLGLSFMQSMGVPIERGLSAEEAQERLKRGAEWMTEERIRGLAGLPEAPADIGAVFEVAAALNGPTYNTDMPLCFTLVSTLARMCLEKGLTPWAPVSLIVFALLIGAALHDVPKAHLLAEVTLKIFRERFYSDALVPFFNVSTGGFITHRHSHLRNTLPELAEGMEKGLSSGSFQFVGYCAWWYSWHQLFLGHPLAKVAEVCLNAMDTCRRVQMERFRDWCALIRQLVLNLQGRSLTPWVPDGEEYLLKEMKARATELGDFAEVFRIKFFTAWLHYLFDRAEAAELFRDAESYLLYGVGLYLVPLFYFYDTLANAAACSRLDGKGQSSARERMDRNIKEFEVWVRHAPMNHLHKLDLMEAEKARIEGRNWDSVSSYIKAVKGAAENGFVNDEALANELFAGFWKQKGYAEQAAFHARKAQALYARWGAEAKAASLEASIERGADPVLPAGEEAAASGVSGQGGLAYLLNAARNLSGALDFGDLLAGMTRILLELQGAQRVLILLRFEKGWFIEAEGRADREFSVKRMHAALAADSPLSLNLFNSVVRSGEAAVVADASEDSRLAGDASILSRGVRSILCAPVTYKGRTGMALYMENSLTSCAFGDATLSMIKLLSGQMAVSLENALRLSGIEELAARRGAELAEARLRAEKAARAKSAFLAGMGRELRSPLNTLLGYAQLMERGSENGRQSLSEDQRRNIEIIRRNGERLLLLITNILDFSKVEAGQLVSSPVDFDVRGLFEELRGAFESRAEAKRLWLRFESGSSVPRSLRADESRLRQILSNLVDRAIEKTEAGGITVRAQAVSRNRTPSAAQESHTVLEFSVSDTGPGLASAEINRLFEPPSEAPTPGQADFDIGLFVCLHYARLLGGELAVQSREGRGTVFRFNVIARP
jgi:predicted ATPase/signal transduction histidine kinase